MTRLKFNISLFIIFLASVGCFDCRKYYLTTAKKVVLSGIITRVYEDEKNHTTPMIIINESKTYNLGELYDLFTQCEVNDSIYKAEGSLDYCLIKKDTILVFNPKCHGETIK